MKQAEIALLLPEIFQRTVAGTRDGKASPIDFLLAVMDALHAPSEAILENLDRYFNPYQADDNFVPFLATWVDLTELLRETPAVFQGQADQGMCSAPLATGMGRLRELVAAAAYLSQWRGTEKGLRRFLETATGVSGFIIKEQIIENGQEKPYHLQIEAPKSTEQFRPLLEKIIDLEKPAYVTYQLEFV